jgi:hypothetical protein
MHGQEISNYTPPKPFRIAAFLLCGLLVLYAGIRAWTVAITHDEAYTLHYFVWDTIGHIVNPNLGNANNHILNTILCKLIRSIFGENIFLLRLYVVTMFGFYLWYGYRLLRYTNNGIVTLCGLVFIGANPFLLDFFSLIRGYGGALTCLMASLYYTALYFHTNFNDRRALWKALIAVGLSVFFNLSFFNIFLPVCGMLAAFIIVFTWRQRTKELLKQIWRRLWPALVVVLLVSAHTIPKAMHLKEVGELSFGGTTGIWSDAGFTLLYYSSFGKQYGLGEWWNLPAIEYLVTGLFYLAGIVFLISRIRLRAVAENNQNTFANLALFTWLITATMLLSLVLQHYVLGNTYPNGRLIIFLAPLYMLCVLFLLRYAVQLHKLFAILPVTVAIALAAHLIYSGNFTHTLYWQFDADTDTMLEDLKQLTQNETNPVTLGIDWVIEPGGNYYRQRYHYESWLQELNREGLKPDQPWFYCGQETKLPVDRYQVVKEYPVSGFRLVKNLEVQR